MFSPRSDFGAFQSCPIPKQFGFQTVSGIRTILFGFQMLGRSTRPTERFDFGRLQYNRTIQRTEQPECLKSEHLKFCSVFQTERLDFGHLL